MKGVSLLIALLVILIIPASAAAYQVSAPNCGGLHWAANQLPLDYYINNVGSDDFTMPALETIIDDSFDAWEAPCCSSFSARYQGQTNFTAYNTGGNVVLSFVENQWDDSWGDINSTIGITFTSYNPQSCTLGNAPIVFNGVRFNFTSNNTGTDLQSIATHEVGHLLGLDHSSLYQATLYYAYQGGTTSRTLHQDDIDGVCYLYERPCTCSSSNDCLEGDICQNGVCQNIPCTSSANCQDGLECVVSTGECVVPPCTDDASCPGGFFCRADGKCTSRCPVCRECTTNNDCGSQGVCVTQIGKCVTFCQQGNVCPGDAVCFDYDGNDLCLNPDAGSAGFCPEDYVCEDDTPVGECQVDVNCAANETCVDNTCVPREDPCLAVTCSGTEQCVNGVCVPAGNNGTGNNGGGNNGTNGENNGTNGENNGTGPVVIIFPDDNKKNEGDSCATSPLHSPKAPYTLIAMMIGLLFFRKRRD